MIVLPSVVQVKAPNVRIEVRDAATKRILEVRRVANTFTDGGLRNVRDLWGGIGVRPDKIALGSSDDATTATMTGLVSELARKTIDRRVQLATGVEFQVFLGSADLNGTTIREVGLFAGSALLARAILSPELEKSGSLEFTISHTLTAARP